MNTCQIANPGTYWFGLGISQGGTKPQNEKKFSGFSRILKELRSFLGAVNQKNKVHTEFSTENAPVHKSFQSAEEILETVLDPVLSR